MYLAITLNRLDDFDNACQAYEKAIEMEEDHLFHLNYAITLMNNSETSRAQQHFAKFEVSSAAQHTAKPSKAASSGP